MIRKDFLILYEHKERELENACLIKYCLEKKGYLVSIKPIYSYNQFLIDAKVIIVPHLYNAKQTYMFISKYGTRHCKVINLQYEQVLSVDPKNSDYSIPKDDAKKSVIFAWGEAEKKRYKDDINQKCEVVGNISMDFNSSIFDQYFLSKDEIRNEFNIEGKQLILFMSSFSMVNYTDEKLKESYPDNYQEMKEFTELSNESRAVILKWFSHFLDHTDAELIYRPHPAENIDSEIIKLEKRHKNFHVIRKYSIRQWIRVSDRILNWFSTSEVDVYYGGKNSILLRPVAIPKLLDVPFFIDAETITTEEMFVRYINEDLSTKYNTGLVSYYYGDRKDSLSIYGFINKCEEILLNDEDYEIVTWSPMNKSLEKRIRSFIRDILYDINTVIPLGGIYRIAFRRNKKLLDKSLYIQREIYGYKKLEQKYEKKLAQVNELV